MLLILSLLAELNKLENKFCGSESEGIDSQAEFYLGIVFPSFLYFI